MLQKLSDRLYGWTNGWIIFILFLLDGFFAGFLLPLIQGMMQGGQGDILPLDLMLFATPPEFVDDETWQSPGHDSEVR